MKAKFGSIIVAGSGKIGGHVASRNRSGAYLRTKVTPVNPQTASQNLVRSRLTGFSQAWRGLTEDERSAWNAAVGQYARTDIFGDLKNPTGFNLFQRINNNLDQVGAAGLDAPGLLTPVLTVQLGEVVAATVPTFTVATSGAVPANTSMIVRATPSLSPGISFVKSEYRIVQVLAAAAASPHNILAAYVAKFGALVGDQKVFVSIEFVNTANGLKSGRQSIGVIVAD
jgi:hypothetical protein